jgi:hypothetical protein
MALGLGNNLIKGGGSGNADRLSLDLQFAADKTLTARKGPTPVFTRASTATYYGPLVQFGGQTYPSTGVVNGRTEWKIVDGGNYKRFIYSGGRWKYEELFFDEGFDFFAAFGAELRPEQADWSASGLTASPTTSSTFGIIRAANNEPRFDHDPLTLACKGLLIEEARTNLMTQSEQWSGTFSGPLAPTITADTTTAPDGLLSADTLSGSTGTAPDGGLNSAFRTITVSSSTTHTFSIYVKSLGVATQAEIRIRDNSTGVSGQTLDTSLTSSWKRISVTLTTGAATTSVRCIIQNTNGDIAIWGAQLEAGSFPTSYIPTTTAALARSADVCSITGSDLTSIYNAPEGTWLTRFVHGNPTPAFSMLVDPFSNGPAIQVSTVVSAGIRNVFNFGSTPVVAGLLYAAAYGYRAGDHGFSVNAGSVITSANSTAPANVATFAFGSRGSTAINGHIAAIRYYKKRLANAKLQSLTS